jgi:hypothetical protein
VLGALVAATVLSACADGDGAVGGTGGIAWPTP